MYFGSAPCSCNHNIYPDVCCCFHLTCNFHKSWVLVRAFKSEVHWHFVTEVWLTQAYILSVIRRSSLYNQMLKFHYTLTVILTLVYCKSVIVTLKFHWFGYLLMSRDSQSSVHSACDPGHCSALVQMPRSCIGVLSLKLHTYFKITQLLDQEAVETVILFDLTMSVILLEQNFSNTLQKWSRTAEGIANYITIVKG